jgi:lipopolysaccharide transport system permease protein
MRTERIKVAQGSALGPAPPALRVIAERLDFGGMLGAAWRYRSFILSSIRNEYRARFARSKLGGLWMVIHPLVNAAIFALVLAEVIGARLPGMAGGRLGYAIYVTTGMLAWSLFAEVLSRCLTIFIENGSVLQKLYFPRICLPLIVAGTALLNNVLMFLAIILIFALLGHFPGPQVLWVPLLMIIPLALGLGFGLLLGVFNVFVRDVGQVVPVVLQLAFWFTPIVYQPNLVPASIRSLLQFNPLVPVVKAYQDIMLSDIAPQWEGLFGVFGVAVALLALSLFIFRRASTELVDSL